MSERSYLYGSTMNFVILEKARPYTRIRRSRWEYVKGYEGRPSKEKAKTESHEIVKGMDDMMKIFKQSKGMCGPASIRIALSAFGKSMTEEQVAKLAKSTASTGTSHDNLVNAVRQEGIHVITYHNLSKVHALNILKEYTAKGNPIIVDWMKTKLQRGGDVGASEGMKPGVEEAKTKKAIAKEENEHYSVVQKVSGTTIQLLDPLESKVEKLPIDYFMDRWFTMSEKTKRWMVVLQK